MLNDTDKIWISEHRSELYNLYKNGTASPEIWDWLKTKFFRECWTCPAKVKINISNLLKFYDNTKTKSNNQ